MDTFKLLQTLTETPGPSGNESLIAAAVQAQWKPYVDTFQSDYVGNLIAVKKGKGKKARPRLLVAAHMDEIALMVSQVIDHQGQGFLRVTSVGGVDRRHLYGQLVIVHGKRDLSGIIGALPDSMLPEEKKNKPFDFETLIVDPGLTTAELQSQVSIGDFVTFRQPLRKLMGRRVAGKALDNRASVAAITIALDYLNGRSHSWDVVAVATSQEETRLLGAFTSAHSQRPDAAVALDVTFGKGPGATDTGTFDIGGGPTIELGPNVHPGMFDALQKAAQSLEMKTGISTHSRASGTDAFGLQIAREGIPTGLIGIPLRYMHTMVEHVDLADIERTGRLLGEFIVQLDAKFLDNLTAGLMDTGAKKGKKEETIAYE